jgi:membrane fusion protein, heavy metal efflux system
MKATDFLFRLFLVALLPAGIPFFGGCDEGGEDEDEEEGKTNKAKVEEVDGFQVLVLAEDEEKSLGIRLEAAEGREVPRHLEVSGWVEAPPGRSVEVRAPVAGRLVARVDWPAPGKKVAAEDVLASLLPVFAPADRIQAEATIADLRAKAIDLDRDVAVETAALEAAEASLARANQLLQDTAGSRKALDEAKVKRAEASAGLTAAQSKRADLDGRLASISATLTGGTQGGPPPVDLRPGIAGTIAAVRASPGENVEAGRVLFEVADLGTAWIRVPVFEGDLGRFDPTAPIELVLSGTEGDETFRIPAAPAARSPAVDPARRSVDLFYAVPDAGARLLLGQSVAVEVPTREKREALVAPASAVVLAADGTAWAYVARGERRYSRVRVEPGVRWGDRVEIRRGLKAGQEVVAAGAVELFGSEFGAGVDRE